MDCGVLQVTKLTNGFYPQKTSYFRVMVTEAPSACRGGVAIFYREVEHFAIKELRPNVPNVIVFQLVTGWRQRHVVGCYIAPIDASTTEDVAVAIKYQPYRDELLVARDLSTNMAEPGGTLQGEAIEDILTSVGLMDMVLHFLPRHKPWLQDKCTRRMQRDGQDIRSRTNSILEIDCRLF